MDASSVSLPIAAKRWQGAWCKKLRLPICPRLTGLALYRACLEQVALFAIQDSQTEEFVIL